MAPWEVKTKSDRNGTWEEMQFGASGTKLDLRKKVKNATRNSAYMAACTGVSKVNKGYT